MLVTSGIGYNKDINIYEKGGDMHMIERAKKLLQIIEESGYEAFIIGGAVRDILLHRSPKDIDIVTSAEPEIVIEIMRSHSISCTDCVGKAFGVVVVNFEGASFEIATYREEVYGEDSHRPESISYAQSLEDDVKRRDFTVNALAMDYFGHIYDYTDGERDLQRKVLRAIGEPVARFREDALRLFRFCRFIGQLGFNPDKKTQDSMVDAFDRVKGLSLERVKIEIEKLLLSPFVAKGMDVLVQSGLSNESCRVIDNGKIEEVAILPELEHLVDLPQERAFHKYDGWLHTLVALQESKAELTIRWAVLLHDVAKGLPNVREIRKGRLTDYGHDKEGAKIAREILTRLRYPKRFVDTVEWLVANHMHFHYFAVHEEANAIKWIRKEALSGRFRNAAELSEAFALLTEVCIADVIGCGKENSATEGTKAFGEYMVEISKEFPIHTRDLKYGAELIALSGAQTGQMLKALLKQVQDGQIENKEEVLLEQGQRWLKRHEV